VPKRILFRGGHVLGLDAAFGDRHGGDVDGKLVGAGLRAARTRGASSLDNCSARGTPR